MAKRPRGGDPPVRAPAARRDRQGATGAARPRPGHAIAFDIEAELWAEPVPLRLLLRTLIDLEDGAASVRPPEPADGPPLPRLLRDRAALPARPRRRVRGGASGDRRASGARPEFLRRPLRRATARRRGVPGRPGAAQARRRVSALHRAPARHPVPRFPGAHALDGAGQADAGPERWRPRRRLPDRRAARASPAGSGRACRRAASSRPRMTSPCSRSSSPRRASSAAAPWRPPASPGGARSRRRSSSTSRRRPERPFRDLALDRLVLHLVAGGRHPWRLYEALLGHGIGLLAREPGGQWQTLADREPVRRVGFADGEALLPPAAHGLPGLSAAARIFLVSRSASCSSRWMRLAPAVAAAKGGVLELAVLLDRADPALEEGVAADDLALFATPAINLFEKAFEPVRVDRRQRDLHLVVDRLRPADFEVHSLLEVTGDGAAGARTFRPFYALAHPDESGAAGAYYTVERRQRLATAQEIRRAGTDRRPAVRTRPEARLGQTRSGYAGRRAVSGPGRRQRAALAGGRRPAARQGALHQPRPAAVHAADAGPDAFRRRRRAAGAGRALPRRADPAAPVAGVGGPERAACRAVPSARPRGGS